MQKALKYKYINTLCQYYFSQTLKIFFYSICPNLTKLRGFILKMIKFLKPFDSIYYFERFRNFCRPSSNSCNTDCLASSDGNVP